MIVLQDSRNTDNLISTAPMYSYQQAISHSIRVSHLRANRRLKRTRQQFDGTLIDPPTIANQKPAIVASRSQD